MNPSLQSENLNSSKTLVSKILGFFSRTKIFWFDFLYLAIVVVISVLFFNHEDTAITSIQSNVLMDDIFQGRFLNFYSGINARWNANQVVSRDFANVDEAYLTVPAIYPIYTYLFYGFWNLIPHLLFLLFGSTSVHATFFLIWAKVLEGVFCAITVHFCIKICRLYCPDLNSGRSLAYYFLGSTFLLFGSLIFNQIEIFYSTFFVVGLYYFLKKKYVVGFCFFSLSCTFKYFPLVPVAFLLISLRPKFKDVVKFILILIAPMVLQAIVFTGNVGYGQMGYIRDFGTRWFDAKLSIGNGALLFFLAWCLLGAIIAFVRPLKKENDRFPLWLSLYCFAGLLCTVNSNPQWFALLAAPSTLVIFLSKRPRLSAVFETFAGLGYLIFIQFVFAGNSSVWLMRNGFVEQLFPAQVVHPQSLISILNELTGLETAIIKNAAFTVFFVGMVGLLAINFDMIRSQDGKAVAIPDGKKGVPFLHQLLRCSIVWLYIIPSFWIYYGTYSVQTTVFKAEEYQTSLPVTLNLKKFEQTEEFVQVSGIAYRSNQVNAKNTYSIIFDDPGSDNDYLCKADRYKYNLDSTSWVDDCGFYAMPRLSGFAKNVIYNVYVSFVSNGAKCLINTGKQLVL